MSNVSHLSFIRWTNVSHFIFHFVISIIIWRWINLFRTMNFDHICNTSSTIESPSISRFTWIKIELDSHLWRKTYRYRWKQTGEQMCLLDMSAFICSLFASNVYKYMCGMCSNIWLQSLNAYAIREENKQPLQFSGSLLDISTCDPQNMPHHNGLIWIFNTHFGKNNSICHVSYAPTDTTEK